MMRFKENNCRSCKKVFCCKNCRENHESSFHNIYMGCDICIYGKAIIRDPDDDLLVHIKENHWPLHCLNCNKIYNTTDELLSHNKCPLAKKLFYDNSAKTPMRPPVPQLEGLSFEYDSPPIANMFKFTPSGNELLVNPSLNRLKTSTPMQIKTDIEFSDVSDVTPVVREKQNFKEEDYENIVNEEESQKDNSKRRVTFNESVYQTCVQSANEKKSLKSSLKKSKSKPDRSSVGCYELPPETPVKNNDIKTENNDNSNVQQPVTPKTPNETTMWESAVFQTEEICTDDEYVKSTQLEHYEEHSACTNSELDDIQNVSIKHEESEIKITYRKSKNVHAGIWTSMTTLVKTFMSGLSGSSVHSEGVEVKSPRKQLPTSKRQRVDDSFEELCRFKKMKFTDIKARKPINDILPYQLLRKRTKPTTCDKATQTE